MKNKMYISMEQKKNEKKEGPGRPWRSRKRNEPTPTPKHTHTHTHTLGTALKFIRMNENKKQVENAVEIGRKIKDPQVNPTLRRAPCRPKKKCVPRRRKPKITNKNSRKLVFDFKKEIRSEVNWMKHERKKKTMEEHRAHKLN